MEGTETDHFITTTVMWTGEETGTGIGETGIGTGTGIGIETGIETGTGTEGVCRRKGL
jgi:hypothetical protein